MVQTITRDHMKPLIEPYGLAEAVRAGDLLYIAGQTGLDDHHQIAEGGLRAQAAQAFRNIRAIIEFAGGRPENLVHLTWYLADGHAARSFMAAVADICTPTNFAIGVVSAVIGYLVVEFLRKRV